MLEGQGVLCPRAQTGECVRAFIINFESPCRDVWAMRAQTLLMPCSHQLNMFKEMKNSNRKLEHGLLHRI